jgi:hypothetical protein
MRRRLAGRLALSVAVIVILLGSVALLSYARWVRGIEAGNRALALGNTAEANQAYDSAARQIAFLPSAQRILLPGYRELFFNRARIFYAEQRYDDLARFMEIEAAQSPQLSDDAEYYYWLGNVQFRKAMAQKEKQQTQSGLQQAAESYRHALAASPGEWDSKYNYELCARLLEGLRKGKDDNLDKIKRGSMKLLREDNQKKEEQQRQVAPEKRG